LVRSSGTDPELKRWAERNALALGAGSRLSSSFCVMRSRSMSSTASSAVPEVAGIYCATANPVQVILAESDQGRGVLA